MADDSELDYIKTFISKVNTAHTVATIETVRNINTINDTQCVLVFSGETLQVDGIIIERQYEIQYKDASEGAMNTAIYALAAGIRKLNKREAITDYTKPATLVGMKILTSGKTFFNKVSGCWYEKVILLAWWLTET